MLSTPGVEATDSTLSEFNNYSEQIRNKTQMLRELGMFLIMLSVERHDRIYFYFIDPDFQWTPHKVDQSLWVYYLARDLKPQLLEDMPRGDDCLTKKSSLADADDDNANVVPANENEELNGSGVHHHFNNGNNNDSNHLHDATSTSLSSIEKNECLNGIYNGDSSASVPFSEEEVSQGGASCSSVNADSSTTGMGIGFAPPLLMKNGVTTNGKSVILSSSVGDDDSKDCMDSEDSRGALMMSNSTTPSEENSVDEPPLKRQKTLELSSAFAAATAAADVTEL